MNTIKTVPRLISLVAILGVVTACSTIVEGTDQTVTVNSDPSGAECMLTREGLGVGTASPTPQTLTVDRGDEDIIVSCKKEGYLSTNATLPSEVEGMTFGNILFGGLIGVAVDAASDANAKYPDSIMVEMIPESFPSDIERDLFFDKMITDAVAKVDKAEEEIMRRCNTNQRPQELCDSDVDELQQAFDMKFEDIERMRKEAKVADSQAAG
jgi:hypothetical protein